MLGSEQAKIVSHFAQLFGSIARLNYQYSL